VAEALAEASAAPADGKEPTNPVLRATFQRTVDDGTVRLRRTLPGLLATGVVGGADVTMGVLALYFVRRDTHSAILGALAFGIGFIALTLANSELFTENFLVPVAAVVARDATVRDLLRLWVGTLSANLAGAWVLTGLILAGFPNLTQVARAVPHQAAVSPLDLRTLANMIVAGAVITLMTWMERSTESVPAKLVAAVSAAFLLAAGPLDHAIVVSVEMFGALHAGAPFGYLSWLGYLGFAILGNMIGGLGLVTLLRIFQVGRDTVQAERIRRPGSRIEQALAASEVNETTE
jgi:formate/nitrite transporter FocA (FNT family)